MKLFATQKCSKMVVIVVVSSSSHATNQSDQIGRFLKVLGNKISSKSSQIIGNFLGYFEYPHSYVKTAVATFWATLGNIWTTFYFNIWSHCNQSIQPFIHSSPTYKCILHFYHNCWKIEIKIRAKIWNSFPNNFSMNWNLMNRFLTSKYFSFCFKLKTVWPDRAIF